MSEILEQPVTNLESEEDILASVRAEAEAMKSALEIETTDKVEDVETKEEKVSSEESNVDVKESANAEEPETKTKEEPTDDKPLVFKEPITLKNRGMTIPVNNMDELIKIAEQGLDYTRKTNELAPYRKTIEYIKATGIEESDLQMLAEIKSGNKTAINGLVSKYNIDVDSYDDTAKFQPQVDVRIPNDVDYVAQEIMSNPELANNFKNIVQYVPDSFKTQLASDANVLRAFSTDVERGIAQQILPEANKLMMLNPGMDFTQAYVTAGNKVFAQPAATEPTAQAPVTTPKVVPNASSDAKAKASIGSKAGATPDSSIDIWENGLSDAELVARIQAEANKLRNKG